MVRLDAAVAAACGLPVNLHARRAEREVLAAAIAFRERTGLGTLMHWFTNSKTLARKGAEAGIFISVGPSVMIGARAARLPMYAACPCRHID